MNRVEGKVAFIIGAARGQGRSHALRMAQESADIIAVDDDGVAQLGRLGIVSANAGITGFGAADELTEQELRDMIDTNLTGVWHTAKVAVPHIRADGRAGSIVLTSSTAGLSALANIAHYGAAKHGVVGLMRALALKLAPEMIRVNSAHPTGEVGGGRQQGR